MKALRGPLRKQEAHLWERDPHDWYIEPSWVSRRLFEEEKFIGGIHDPACGTGRILRMAREKGFRATGSDIVHRCKSQWTWEWDWLGQHVGAVFDNIVSNPPFGLCDNRRKKSHPFVERCLERAKLKVALLMPANWVQGDARSRWLETTPLARVWFISPRPSMPPGPVIEAGGKPGNGTTDYAWFVWEQGHDGPAAIRWLRRDGRQEEFQWQE